MILFALTLLTGCTADVYPGPDGINTVWLFSDDRQDGMQSALRQAKRYCKQQDQRFAVLDEKVDFICEMDESDYIRARQLAEAAQAAGAVTSAVSEEDSNAELIGDILQAGGVAAEASLPSCYEVELTFECMY